MMFIRRHGCFGLLRHIRQLGPIMAQVPLDTLIDLLQPALHLRPGEVAIAIVDRLELAAIDGHEGIGKQVELAAQHHELATHQADRFTVVFEKICDGLEVWRQAFS